MKRCKDCGGPRFGFSLYCAKCSTGPAMTRTPDHATSEKAAAKVRRTPLRMKVIAFAEQAEGGFIDHDLQAIDRDAPESSLRKRRSELTHEGLILATESVRPNSNGEDATVFIHRKFHPAPPPMAVPAKGKAAKAIQRAKREAMMFNALVRAAVRFHGEDSSTGRAIAEALDIPFPIRVTDLPAFRPL